MNAIALENTGEESLGEVLGIMLMKSATANIGVERVPILFAKFRKGLGSGGGIAFAGLDHEGPAGVREVAMEMIPGRR